MILDALALFTVMTMSPYRPLPGAPSAADHSAHAQAKPVNSNKNRTACDMPQGVAKLPYAHGHRFCSLDEYLAHLERFAAPIDQPWWRPVRPGVYEHVKRMTGATRETATRAQLMKRFGFSK